MVKTRQCIIGQQCLRNDDLVLAANDEDKKIASQKYKKNIVRSFGTQKLHWISLR